MVAIFYLIACAVAATLSGKIRGIDSGIAGSQVSEKILNGINFPSRFLVNLIQGNKLVSTLVNGGYQFEFPSLETGEYLLDISSYDFVLSLERYRVFVENEAAEGEDEVGLESVLVYKESLFKEGFNKTSKVTVDSKHPLIVEVINFKEYYERPSGSLKEMLDESPFGFIFKNSLYTGLFMASIGVMIAPYFLRAFFPEMMEEYEQMQMQGPPATQQEPDTSMLDKIQEISGTTGTGTSGTGRGGKAQKRR